MSTALIIGGNGFIGSHLTDLLVASGWQVRILDLQPPRYSPLPPNAQFFQGDLNQVALLREALAGVQTVFHLAWSSIHETANRNLEEDILNNLVPSVRLLEYCVWAGVRRVIYTSSGGTVYGPARQVPIREDHPTQPINAYGVLKLTVEKYLHMFQSLHGLEYAVLRPSVPYGPRQNPLGRQGAVAVFLYRVWQHLPLTVWGDGSSTRDFFYIDDLSHALLACAQAAALPAQPVFNIGGGVEISLLELIRQVESLTGRAAEVQFLPVRGIDAPRVALDIQHARQSLNWQPQVSFETGLQATWEWMRQNFPSPEQTNE